MSLKLDTWNRSSTPAFSQQTGPRAIRLSAGRGITVHQPQPAISQASTPPKDFTYYQLKATREAIENIRRLATILSKDLYETEDTVIVNINVLTKQESFREELAVFYEKKKLTQLSKKYFHKTEQGKVGSLFSKAFGIKSQNVQCYTTQTAEDWEEFKKEATSSVSEEDMLDSISGVLKNRYPGKKIVMKGTPVEMAEAIAQEAGLTEEFPSQSQVELNFRSLSNDKKAFYDNIAKGVLFAFFVPRNHEPTIKSLNALNLNKLLAVLNYVEGKEINDASILRCSRIFIQSIIYVTNAYANNALGNDISILNDVKRSGWNYERIASIASN